MLVLFAVRRSVSSWAKCLAEEWKQGLYLALIEGPLWQTMATSKSAGLDKPHLEKKGGGVSRGSPPPGYSALPRGPLTLVELP